MDLHEPTYAAIIPERIHRHRLVASIPRIGMRTITAKHRHAWQLGAGAAFWAPTFRFATISTPRMTGT